MPDRSDNVQSKPDLADIPVKPEPAREADQGEIAADGPPAEDLTLPTE